MTSESFMRKHYGASGYVKHGSVPDYSGAATEMYEALKVIVSRVALTSPYYEMARVALTKAETGQTPAPESHKESQ